MKSIRWKTICPMSCVEPFLQVKNRLGDLEKRTLGFWMNMKMEQVMIIDIIVY